MKFNKKKGLILILCLCLILPVIAYELPKPVTLNIIYEGSKEITDSLTSKATTAEKTIVLAETTDKIMAEITYPYQIPNTEITITDYQCIKEICGYWITAYRKGQEVYTNSPIWISPPPYLKTVSTSYDSKTNIQTVTLKESLQDAVNQVLSDYVNRQPIGKAITRNKDV